MVAEDTANVFFDRKHAIPQMEKRGIDRSQVMECLRKGIVVEGPYKTSHGSWRVNLERMASGDELVVVVDFDTVEQVLVVTAFVPGMRRR